MKRRGFLGAASAGLAVTLWPDWLQEAFGDAPAPVGPVCDPVKGALRPIAILAAAFHRAREGGKPLLVLVIPADDGQKWGRGQTFGELLNHGSDRDLAPLAGVEVVCATMADLRRLVPGAGSGEPLMVLAQPARVPATARQLDVALPAYKDPEYDKDYSWEKQEKAEDETADRRIAAMGQLLRDSLGLDERRAAPLAAEVRARLTKVPPSGTRWANASGCGTEIEGEKDNLMVMCGMGHTPRKGRRFLYFFARKIL